MSREGGPLRFGVIGADHLHLFQMVDRLVASGATAVAHVPEGGLVDLYAGWQAESAERHADDILGDDSIDLVVLAGVPRDRASVAVAALRAGKHVLSDKPGVTTLEQLADVRAALAGRPGRPWTVLFSERFENRAISAAVEMARDDAVGRVVHVVGAGPHLLSAEHRPDWFWDDAATGGILVDIGSHQADQFLAVAVGAGGPSVSAEVRQALVGNVACDDHPGMQDIGSMTLAANGVVGDHRVDYLTATGLGTWGDVRLTIIGTAGTIEVRANVDPAGSPGNEHLIVVDADGTRRVDVSDRTVTWAGQLIADIADDGERLMSQAHVLAVCEVVLRAQQAATAWGGPEGTS
jgi:predicted dehydrogenase